MLILCKFLEYWYLASFAPNETRRFGVRAGNCMPNHGGFLPRSSSEVARSMDFASETLFFPTIRYRGALVYPKKWNPDSAEPLLSVVMMPWDLREAGLSIDELVADGWQYDQRDGGEKYVHVDELEKIDGPPPGASAE